MKKITLSLVMIIIAITVFAQAPQAFKYQAVARDNGGNVISNQNVSFQISILEGSTSGTAVYVETHDTLSNEFGLVNLEIGNGSIVSGVFADIDWGGNIYFLQIEMDENGGEIYQLMGTSQLLSVPYALYSEATGDSTRWKKNNDDLYYLDGNVGIGTDNPTDKFDVRGAGTDDGVAFTIGNSDLSHRLSLFGGRENDPNPFIQWKTGDPLRFSTDDGGWSEKIRITSDGNVGIGVSDPDAKLEVNGQLKITDGNEGADKVLTSDANGLATWEEAMGSIDVGPNYGTVVNPATGKTWLDRNLGASQVATSSTDALAYGDLYQWGRAQEGHEDRTSTTHYSQASSWLADEGSNLWDGKFIIGSNDWLSTAKDDLWSGTAAENNPCPSGFRLPTNAELNQERLSWSSNDAAGAYGSPLKLVMGGYHDGNDGLLHGVGNNGYYWSSSGSGNTARLLYFYTSSAAMNSYTRASGQSVRCIKD